MYEKNNILKNRTVLTITSALVLFASTSTPDFTFAQTPAQQLQQQIATIQAQIAQLQSQLRTPHEGNTLDCTGITFGENLTLGSMGNEVKCLQEVLNSDPDTEIAHVGPGSPGNESNIFGLLTKTAVVRFQEKYAHDILTPTGSAKGTGFVGARTREKLNRILVKPTSVQIPTSTLTQTLTPSSAPTDTAPPVISNISPAFGTILPINTAQVSISVDATDATPPVTCRYSMGSDSPYSTMTGVMNKTGDKTYSATITGLTNGGNYLAYVRCIDSAIAPNADIVGTLIYFSVGGSGSGGSGGGGGGGY